MYVFIKCTAIPDQNEQGSNVKEVLTPKYSKFLKNGFSREE